MSAKLIYDFFSLSEFIATGATIAGIVIQYFFFKKQKKIEGSKKKIGKKKLITLTIIIVYIILGIILILNFQERITTLVQEGYFRNLHPGIHNIQYPCAYNKKPYLFIEKIDDEGEVPIIQDERVDGFKVRIYPKSSSYRWIAKGIPQECDCK